MLESTRFDWLFKPQLPFELIGSEKMIFAHNVISNLSVHFIHPLMTEAAFPVVVMLCRKQIDA